MKANTHTSIFYVFYAGKAARQWEKVNLLFIERGNTQKLYYKSGSAARRLGGSSVRKLYKKRWLGGSAARQLGKLYKKSGSVARQSGKVYKKSGSPVSQWCL